MTQVSKWKIIGYAMAIFAAGGISGGALGIYETKLHMYAPAREPDVEMHILRRFQTQLDLTPDQVEKIKPIVRKTAEALHKIRIDGTVNAMKILDDSYSQVSAILTPDQRVKLEEMRKERLQLMEREEQNRLHPGEPGASASRHDDGHDGQGHDDGHDGDSHGGHDSSQGGD